MRKESTRVCSLDSVSHESARRCVGKEWCVTYSWKGDDLHTSRFDYSTYTIDIDTVTTNAPTVFAVLFA